MDLSVEEQDLLALVIEVLERKQFSEALEEEDIPGEAIRNLLKSENTDLSDIGLYVLTLRKILSSPEAQSELAQFTDNALSANNLAGFIYAELGAGPGKDFIDEPPGMLEMLRGSFDTVAAATTETAPAHTARARAKDMTIIVHGTWAANKYWWRKGSPFWNHIQGNVGNVYAGDNPFSWSGSNDHSAREQGAVDLENWVASHPATSLDVIAHSHGGNVCLLASRNGLKIRKLINLGTPIRLEYLPGLNNIDTLHNVFSTWDHVQTPAGTAPNRRAEGRTLGDSLKVTNHRAHDDGHGGHPGHSDLHEPATWTASKLDSLL